MGDNDVWATTIASIEPGWIRKGRRVVREAYGAHHHGGLEQPDDFTECMIDMREYDVPYHVRCMIDADIRVGSWYNVRKESGNDSAILAIHGALSA